MKLKKVASLCSKTKIFCLYDREESGGEVSQWLGDSSDYIYGKAEIRFVRGRLRFTDEEGNAYAPAPFPSMVVIYNGKRR